MQKRDEELEKKIIDIQKRIIKKMIPSEVSEELEKDAVDWVVFRRELTHESDRGCALLAASHLDFLLEELLKSKLVGTKKQLQALCDFNGPLGTFSSRILMSYSIGLISKAHVNDLQIIRKIRNEFGHSPSIINFDDIKIASLCDNLLLTVDKTRSKRSIFITSVAFLSGFLSNIKFKEKSFEEKKDDDIEEARKQNEAFRNALKKEFEEGEKNIKK